MFITKKNGSTPCTFRVSCREGNYEFPCDCVAPLRRFRGFFCAVLDTFVEAAGVCLVVDVTVEVVVGVVLTVAVAVTGGVVVGASAPLGSSTGC